MMQPPSPTTPNDPSTRIALTTWVSGALLALLILGAGYALFGSMSSSSTDARGLEPVMPAGAPRFFGQLGAPGGRAQPDGVIVRTAGSRYDVNSGPYRLNATKSRDGKWNVRLTTTRNDLLTPEQDAAFAARWRVTHDSAYAKSLSITPDQLKQLGDIPGKGGLMVADADQEQLRALMDAYVAAAAPREAQGAELTRAVGAIGGRSAETTRQDLLQRVDRIKSILTAEQLAKFIQPR
jgi:hypothetical protein